jgi:type VI secretion system protein ImpK
MDRINWVTRDALNAIMQLTSEADPSTSYTRLREHVEAARRRGAEAGYTESEQAQLAYALAALADEVAMASAGALREHWSQRPLQLALFSDNVAGERFFAELERALEAGRVGVLRTYYMCLVLGFKGRYAVQGGEPELARIRERVRERLARALALPEQLSPDGARPERGLIEGTRRVPWPLVAAGALALSLVGYLAFRVSLHEQLAQFERVAVEP